MIIYANAFIEEEFPFIARKTRIGEEFITLNHYEQAIIEMGAAAEMISKKICKIELLEYLIFDYGKVVNHSKRVKELKEFNVINEKVFKKFKNIYTTRNPLTHQDPDEPPKDCSKKAKEIHKELFELCLWFCKEYGSECQNTDKNYPGVIFEDIETSNIKDNVKRRKFTEDIASKYSIPSIRANTDEEAAQLEFLQDIKRLRRLVSKRDKFIGLDERTESIIEDINDFSEKIEKEAIKEEYQNILKELEHDKELLLDKSNKEEIISSLKEIEKKILEIYNK